MLRITMYVLLIVPALLIAVNAAPSHAQESEEPGAVEVPSDGKKTEAVEEETEEAEETKEADKGTPVSEWDGDEFWKRYVASYREGRSWTYAMANDMAMTTEVIKVTDTEATIRTSITMGGNPMGDPTENQVSLERRNEMPEGEEPDVTWQEKELEVKAGTFVGISMDGENWMMKKYPVIILKVSTMELSEFNDVEGDDGRTTSSDKDEAGKEEEEAESESGKADMDDHWQRYVSTFKKGRKWVYELQGGIRIENEVIRANEEQAVVKTTTLMGGNPIGDPLETEHSLVKTDQPGGDEEDIPEWQEKEIEVKAGTFDCISIDGENWMMKKHPAIVVKTAAMELVEFTDE